MRRERTAAGGGAGGGREYGAGRTSRQRRSIADAALGMERAFTVDELASAARAADPAVGTSTVYRAVGALERSGWLERVGERAGSALFSVCPASGTHHHHVVCDGCGRVSALDCPLDRGVTDAAERGGFTVTRHEVTLYGLCAECAAERDEAGSGAGQS